jgi:hypothetical protein
MWTKICFALIFVSLALAQEQDEVVAVDGVVSNGAVAELSYAGRSAAAAFKIVCDGMFSFFQFQKKN